MSVTVGCDTVLTVDTKLPPSCNFLVSESFKIAVEVYNRWRISLKRLLNKQTNESPSLITDRHLTCQQAVNAGGLLLSQALQKLQKNNHSNLNQALTGKTKLNSEID
ncbi:hypothetical protein YC2023_051229 [Brassica napus]